MTEIRLCEECKHYKMDVKKEPCRYCFSTSNKPNWEPKEKPFTGRSLEDCVTCKYSSHNNGTGITCNEICNIKIDGFEPAEEKTETPTTCKDCKFFRGYRKECVIETRRAFNLEDKCDKFEMKHVSKEKNDPPIGGKPEDCTQKRQCDTCKFQIIGTEVCQQDRTQIGWQNGKFDHDPCEYEPARKSCLNCKYAHEYPNNPPFNEACMGKAGTCNWEEKEYKNWEFTDKPCTTCKHSRVKKNSDALCENSFKMTPARECWKPKKEKEITWSLVELNDFKTYCFQCEWYEKDLFGTDRMYCTLATMPAYQVFIKNDKKCPFDHGKIACKTCKNSSINNETGEHCDKTWKEEAEFRKCWEPVQKKFCFGCKHEGTPTSQESCHDCYGNGTHGRPKWEAEDPSKTCDNCENGPNQDLDDCGACFKQSIWKPKNQEMTPTLLGDDIMSQKRMEEENKIHKELLESFIEHSQSKFETAMEMVSDAVNKPEYKGGLIGTDNANKLRDIRKTLEGVMNINKLQALIKNFKKNKKEGGDKMPEKDIKEEITELEEKIKKERKSREETLNKLKEFIFMIMEHVKKTEQCDEHYIIDSILLEYCDFPKKIKKKLKNIWFFDSQYINKGFISVRMNGKSLSSPEIKWDEWNEIKQYLEQLPDKYYEFRKRELTREYCRLTKDCMKPTKKNECHMCGKKNRKDASFCCQCGHKMGGND